jgi:hypothetical protein
MPTINFEELEKADERDLLSAEDYEVFVNQILEAEDKIFMDKISREFGIEKRKE